MKWMLSWMLSACTVFLSPILTYVSKCFLFDQQEYAYITWAPPGPEEVMITERTELNELNGGGPFPRTELDLQLNPIRNKYFELNLRHPDATPHTGQLHATYYGLSYSTGTLRGISTVKRGSVRGFHWSSNWTWKWTYWTFKNWRPN